ncbi:MAG: hypothetical protein ACHQIG_04230 [Acidimicrobiia bacterium]
MAVLDVDLSFPHSPITSLQKRIGKGIEQLYYARLFLTAPTYADGTIWPAWHERGFHLAIFSPPPGTAAGDKIRVRMRGPSPTPRVSVTGENVDALKDLESMVRAIDSSRADVAGGSEADRVTALRDGELGRVVVQPLVDALGKAGLDDTATDDYLAMLQRAFDALTNDRIQSIDVTLS